MKHPREGFVYPFIEKMELMDHGFAIGALLREADGTLTAVRWKLSDIMDHANVKMTSNVE